MYVQFFACSFVYFNVKQGERGKELNVVASMGKWTLRVTSAKIGKGSVFW